MALYNTTRSIMHVCNQQLCLSLCTLTNRAHVNDTYKLMIAFLFRKNVQEFNYHVLYTYKYIYILCTCIYNIACMYVCVFK